MSRALIEAWYNNELQQHHPQREDARFVTGFPLWGENYVRSFLSYLLPSMLAPVNREALKSAELVLYVDRAAWAMLLACDLPPALTFNVHIRLLSDDIANLMHRSPEWKYVLLTAVQNLLVYDAGKKGAGFGMSCADMVYSNRYFERLLELGKTHDVIATQAIVASEKAAAEEFSWFRKNGVLSITAAELGTLGWERASGLMKSFDLTNNETFGTMPGTHLLMWRGRDYVRMHCPHLTPVWLSAEKCRAMPTHLGETLDATVCGPFYMPQLDDDMQMVTLDNSRDHPADFVPFQVFKDGFQRFLYCRDQFKIACNVPTLPADSGFLPNDVIEQRFQKLCEMMGV